MRRLLPFLTGLLAGAVGLLGAGVAAVVRRPPPREATTPEAPATGEDTPPDVPRKRGLRRLARPFALLLGLLAVGGFLVAASGVVPIKASTGHWSITQWFLRFASRRSVVTHTLGAAAPPRDSLRLPSLVLKGAGHYELACRSCHGSPAHPRGPVARAMTPPPPYLPPVIPAWEDEELFYIVRHGIKFTGMPAWPSEHRDDEVWAMVAFLRALPGMDAPTYRRLVHGPDERAEGGTTPEPALRSVVAACGRCHGADGGGRGAGAAPRLAGQRPTYLYAALQAYARGDRPSGIMGPVAAGLDAGTMRALARYYARLEASGLPAPSPPDTAALARGRALAAVGLPSRNVPSCSDCHGPGPSPRNPAYPTLAGQHADYLVLQLQLFQAGHRGGSAYAHLMHPVVRRLTPAQMRDVARYYESLAARPPHAGS